MESPLTCSIPNPQLVAMCQGDGQCCNVGASSHFIYTIANDACGAPVQSCKLYCPRCCLACQAKKERESKDGNSESK